MGHQQALSEVVVEQSVVEGTPSYSAHFSYVATTGPLANFWMTPFEGTLPILKLSAFMGAQVCWPLVVRNEFPPCLP
ncbi:hypothetical protein GCM10009715_40490 [Paeniglutamicibacter psychrophenolicus]